jgi:hypothetical protein
VKTVKTEIPGNSWKARMVKIYPPSLNEAPPLMAVCSTIAPLAKTAFLFPFAGFRKILRHLSSSSREKQNVCL